MVLLILLAAGCRTYYLTKMPAFSGDLERHLVYGVLVGQRGPEVAAKPLAAISPRFEAISWSVLPYNYPVLALVFFTIVSAISPTLFFGRFALTLVEVVNAGLIKEITGSRWLATLYWISPISIWWVSREGQFEPLQNLFVLVALWALNGKRWRTAIILLTLAVQVKVLAIFFYPWFLYRIARISRQHLASSFLWIAVASLPTIVTHLFFYPTLAYVLALSAPLTYNPYYWNFFRQDILHGGARFFQLIHAGLSYGFLAEFTRRLLVGPQRWSAIAPFLFLLFVKLHTNVLFWYWLIWLPFLLPFKNRRLLWISFLLYPFLELNSFVSVVFAPFFDLHTMGGLGDEGLTPWMPVHHYRP